MLWHFIQNVFQSADDGCLRFILKRTSRRIFAQQVDESEEISVSTVLTSELLHVNEVDLDDFCTVTDDDWSGRQSFI